MALEIIQHGYNPYRKTCPSCNCIFTFSKADIIKLGSRAVPKEGIKCPECKYLIKWLKSNNSR